VIFKYLLVCDTAPIWVSDVDEKQRDQTAIKQASWPSFLDSQWNTDRRPHGDRCQYSLIPFGFGILEVESCM
jgi:hypothetical protein